MPSGAALAPSDAIGACPGGMVRTAIAAFAQLRGRVVWTRVVGPRQPIPRLGGGVIFGGSPTNSLILNGVAGFFVLDGAKQRHKGVLWGMFVRPAARGTGLSLSLVERVLEHAAQAVDAVRLTVVASNTAAVRLYARAGFQEYGLERRALKVGDYYHDELLMALSLRSPS